MPAKGIGGNDFRCRCFINLKTYTMKQVCILLALVCLSWQTYAQFSLKGTVTGSENETLIGAHVIIYNTYYQTITDNNGQFVITGIKPGTYEVQVSYVGYKSHVDIIDFKGDTNLEIVMQESAIISDAVIISAVRASQNSPTTFTMISKEEMNQRNLAQDLPYMLSHVPSVVTYSDAGAGVGYTYLRIRGSDITRINVTINGIPLNDPESHGVYWVDIPDFASSVNSLQLQRGVGSSTNGAGAFGASMNIETNSFQSKPFGIVSLGAGSFNTWKSTFQAGTGMLKNHWYFEGRGSAIGSDGYIERASSALSSFFIQGGYYDDKTLIKAITFGGSEKTYQAWYGVDAYTMQTNRRFNYAGAINEDDGSVRYYNNQTDNYRQNHYQLHISRRLTHSLSLNLSGHYTYGRGYYEEYEQDQPFADYGLNDLYFGPDSVWSGSSYQHFYHDTISATDLIRRRWGPNNHYYGLTWSVRHQKEKIDLILGGAINKFDNAKRFGEIIWAEFASQSRNDDEYYHNSAFKTDYNVFVKAAWSPVQELTIYGDIQYRHISYNAGGIGKDLNPISIQESFSFLNPKAGISYNLKLGTLYASYSIAHREPVRDDYIDALPGERPKPESLGNLELGVRRTEANFQYAFNFYLMNYLNQLVLTGEINDDGAYIRKNAGKSYRTGIELSGGFKPITLFELAGNISLSINKTDYQQINAEGQIITFNNSTISFSPRVVAGAQLKLFPYKNLEFNWFFKYVGEQYLDNTSNKDLVLDRYLINDTRIAYLVSGEKLPAIEFTLMINNLFNAMYESNGFVYDNTPCFYPQAGTNFMAGVTVKF
jgi:iron complex outermembrane receptor protein